MHRNLELWPEQTMSPWYLALANLALATIGSGTELLPFCIVVPSAFCFFAAWLYLCFV